MSLNKCVTWAEINPVDRVLLIINSAPNDHESVDLILKFLHNLVPQEGLWIIAEPHWQEYLICKGLSTDRIQLTALAKAYELIFFLEQPYTIDWVLERKPQLITGSLAHNLYNEEIKELFERRVKLFLGELLFIAHTLPNQYVYLMNMTDLLERYFRQQKINLYQITAKAIIDDFYKIWLEKGQPSFDDEPAFDVENGILAKYLGENILAYDELSEIPLQRVNVYESVAKAWTNESLAYQAKLANLQQEINVRDDLLARYDALLKEANQKIDEVTKEHDRVVYRLAQKIHQAVDKIKKHS